MNSAPQVAFSAPRVLVVEDDGHLREGLASSLLAEGFDVRTVARGDEAVEAALAYEAQLVLLDVMLPGCSGLDVCRDLRERGCDAQIVMLTARAEEVDRVVGFEIGADDYVVKPFSVRELMARIRARLRRPRHGPGTMPSRCRVGLVDVDFDRHEIQRHGQVLDATPREILVLRLLVAHRGELISRDRILDEVWGTDVSVTPRTIDNYILRLRQKIEPDPANPRHILTVYGSGYKFVG